MNSPKANKYFDRAKKMIKGGDVTLFYLSSINRTMNALKAVDSSTGDLDETAEKTSKQLNSIKEGIDTMFQTIMGEIRQIREEKRGERNGRDSLGKLKTVKQNRGD
jgi:hypothetical protein